jgi:hypothetical protein
MPTQLDPEQISGLTSSISDLETADSQLDSRITLEDSINDAVDASLAARISLEDSINDQVDVTLQEQIDDLKDAMLSLVFGNRLDVMNYGVNLIAITPTEFAIPVMSITWVWYFNGEIIPEAFSSFYTPAESGEYKAGVNYQTTIGTYYMESERILFQMPDRSDR